MSLCKERILRVKVWLQPILPFYFEKVSKKFDITKVRGGRVFLQRSNVPHQNKQRKSIKLKKGSNNERVRYEKRSWFTPTPF